MTYKIGIYLSVDGDNAVRVIVKNDTKIQSDNRQLFREEYEKAKNKNYKRVERYKNADQNSDVIPLAFNEYKAWLDKTNEVKRMYLQGKVSDEKLKETIQGID